MIPVRTSPYKGESWMEKQFWNLSFSTALPYKIQVLKVTFFSFKTINQVSINIIQ
jgi:hypothetical protein